MVYRGKPKEIVIKSSTPYFLKDFLYLTFQSNISTNIKVKTIFKKPYEKKTKGPRIIGAGAGVCSPVNRAAIE
jgi:hypothetical protein